MTLTCCSMRSILISRSSRLALVRLSKMLTIFLMATSLPAPSRATCT